MLAENPRGVGVAGSVRGWALVRIAGPHPDDGSRTPHLASLPRGPSTATSAVVTVSSSNDGPRHVGRIVDPLVGGQADREPEIEVSGPSSQDRANSQPEQQDHDDPSQKEISTHPVRQRLLERARAARAEREAVAQPGARGLDELDELGAPKSKRYQELDQVGSLSQPPSAPFVPRGRGQLSPNMVAVFGTLIGLFAVASLVALGMNLDAQAALDHEASAKQSEGQAKAKTKAKRPAGALPERKRKKLPGPWRIVDAKDDPTTKVLTGQIGKKAFLVAVADAGVQQKEAYRLLIAYKGLRDLDNCNPTDNFSALVERGTGRLKAFEYEVSKEEVYQAKTNDKGLLEAKKLDLKVAREQIKGAFMYDGEDFTASVRRAGFEKGLRSVLNKALEGHSSVAELDKNDRVRVIGQEVTVLGEFARYAGIEALEVLWADESQKPLRVYYFHHARAGGYYDANGRAPYEGGWRKPIKGAPITSKFNPKRMHPVLKKVMPHTGTDFGAAMGTPVGASSYGVVSFIGYAGASGNLVKIDHPGGIETGYAHLSRFEPGLKVGDRVKRLQIIGYVGSTGRSTGPHLHFSAKKDGKFFDAETLNLDGMRVLQSEFRGDFEEIKAKYDKLLNAIPVPALEKPEPKPKDEPEITAAESAADESQGDEDALGGEEEDEAEQESVPQAKAAPAEPATPTKNQGATAVYMTDKELLEMQGRVDDGEVEE